MINFILVLLFVFTFSIDQYTKYLTVEYLKEIPPITVIENILSFTYVENYGAAFGILPNAKWLFVLLTVVITLVVLFYTLKYKIKSNLYLTSITLLLSGAWANICDRIFRGFVVDMIKTDFIDFPVFNVADICIVCGATLLGIYLFFKSE